MYHTRCDVYLMNARFSPPFCLRDDSLSYPRPYQYITPCFFSFFGLVVGKLGKINWYHYWKSIASDSCFIPLFGTIPNSRVLFQTGFTQLRINEGENSSYSAKFTGMRLPFGRFGNDARRFYCVVGKCKTCKTWKVPRNVFAGRAGNLIFLLQLLPVWSSPSSRTISRGSNQVSTRIIVLSPIFTVVK